MQDEVLLRAWNAHREYIRAIRGGGAPSGGVRAEMPSSRPGWRDSLLAAIGHGPRRPAR